MHVHELKTSPEHFAKVAEGEKTGDLRRDDREPRFEVGDLLILREFDEERGPVSRSTGFDQEPGYTGYFVVRRVTHVLREHPGIAPGYALLSIESPTIYSQAPSAQKGYQSGVTLEAARAWCTHYAAIKALVP